MNKKIKKFKQEWEMAYKEVNLKPSKLKTLVKTMFASNYLVSRSFGVFYCHESLLYSQ